ncbi:MAG: hypothetical protein ACK5CY_04810 [Bacteroidia bacterium]
MNKCIITFLMVCLCLGAGITLNAQPGHTSMDIIGSYKPKIPDAQKINEQPTITDTVKEKLTIEYELFSRKVNTVYEVDPIKAANMRGELQKKLYPGYFKGGFGTYMSPYAELFYNTTRSKKQALGFHYRHFSSENDLKDYADGPFSRNSIDLNGKTFIKKSVLSGSLDYDRNVVRYYGIPEDSLSTLWKDFDVNPDVLRQRYQLINAHAELNDLYPVDSHATKFKAAINFYNYSALDTAQENSFNTNGLGSFYYKEYDLFVGGDFSYFKNQNALGEYQISLLTLKPGIRFKKDNWRLSANVGLFSAFGDTSFFKVVPELDFDWNIYERFIVLNIGTDSRYERLSYRNLTEQNPFLDENVELRNTWKPFRVYAGLRGAISSRIGYSMRASYVQIENQHYFVNDTTYGNWNKMVVVYDNPGLFEFNGELFWQKSDKMKLSARADYMAYSADVQQRPWHIPSLRMSINGAYKIKDKIKLNAAVHTINRQFARVITSDSLGVPVIRQEELKGIVDVNLGAEYRYSKRIGMFLQLNNVLNRRYFRYMNYPLQRFNALGGITLSF